VTDTSQLNTQNNEVVCLFIPYSKFSGLPLSEIKKIRTQANMLNLKQGLLPFIADKYGVDEEELREY
jgi:hypothetical protein